MVVVERLLEAAVIVLREGVEAALIVAIMLASLRRSGRDRLVPAVFWAVAAAVAASLVVAALIQRLGLDPENEIWEGTIMLVAAVLVGSLLLWMRRARHHLRSAVESGVERLAGGRVRGTLGVFAFVFVMVFREGVETVLFLGALSGAIGGNPMYNAVGGGFGLLLALLFGALLVQGTVRVDLARFFRVTEAVLVVLIAKLLANALHEFFEAGLLPPTEAVLSVVGILTRDTTSLLVVVLLIALPAVLLLRDAWTRRAPAPGGGDSPAEGRKRYAAFRRDRVWTASAGFAGLALTMLLGLSGLAAARGFDPPAVPLPVSGPLFRIPLAEIGGAPLRKYSVEADGVTVRFLVTTSEAGRLAVALDACAICPLRGYHLAGDHLVCGNCGAPVSGETVGVAGGCNPIPLASRVDGGELVIRAEDVAAARARFAHRG